MPQNLIVAAFSLKFIVDYYVFRNVREFSDQRAYCFIGDKDQRPATCLWRDQSVQSIDISRSSTLCVFGRSTHF